MGGRIVALDVLRGVAILGTFGTNVWAFTHPRGVTGFLADFGSGAGDTATALLQMVSNGKFLGLLSIMFGIGLAIQHRSAVRRGRRWPGWYLWRSALLLVEGLLHYVLVFEFDVLMFYAVVSVLVAYLVGRGGRVQVGWMVAMGALNAAVVGLVTAALLSGATTVGDPGFAVAADSWWGGVQARVEHFAVFRAEGFLVLPLSALLFLAGARLFAAGALEDSARGAGIRRRLVAWGLGVGVPANVATTLAGADWFAVDRYVCAPLVAFGLLGGIASLVHRMRAEAGPVRRGLTAVGRSALSCYVGQNVLASALCYDWGLGLARRWGHLGPWFTGAVWLLVAALLLGGASWWMGRFERGPVETVWDWAYRAPQRRSAPV
ncbi:DUF418 domain-containing protein [Saccharothrix texasensis]|uniref:DUF418 domain-containing protein n=1 Tax=Saccharothrix texasensis TaxID=103734 RepID=A0A3N1H357_9PSEU|nr:DUF418 domain-containing protein [Saccharothrix texasensis]ROP36938.1 uncharacterized protein EDD40_2219 [Saccharothrix texasensis]